MMLLLFAAAAVSAAPAVAARTEFGAVTDADFCAIGREMIPSISAKLPFQADAVTRMDRVEMACADRAMVTDRSISADMSDMAADWQEAVRARWSTTTCRNPLFNVMAHKGWRFRQNLTFKSGERVVQDADCSAYPLGE